MDVSNVHKDETSEIIYCTITIQSKKIALVSCYRPPYKANESEFFSSLENSMNMIDDLHVSDTYVIGDHN